MEAYIEKFLSFDWDRINNSTSIILLVVIIICVIIRLLRNSSTKKGYMGIGRILNGNRREKSCM